MHTCKRTRFSFHHAAWWGAVLLWCFTAPCLAAGKDLRIEVQGEERVARVMENRKGSHGPRPLLIAFHGYTGNRMRFSRFVDLHKAWPEAIVVYPQGLRLPDQEGKLQDRGWVTRDHTSGNRDLVYVDALLAELKGRYEIDPDRVYATGFSNGGHFVFLLMAVRSAEFTAFAPVGTTAAEAILGNLQVPRPVLYIVGKQEIANQVERAQATVEALSENNRSTQKFEIWAADYRRFEPEKGGADFIFHLHKGGHIWPWTASEHMVRFFKSHSGQ